MDFLELETMENEKKTKSILKKALKKCEQKKVRSAEFIGSLRTVLIFSLPFDDQVNSEADFIVGDPRKGICSAVDLLNADLLVVGSHGYGPIRRLVMT